MSQNDIVASYLLSGKPITQMECSVCGEAKNIDMFYTINTKSTKRRAYCKVCHNIKGREYRRKNRVAISKQQRGWRQTISGKEALAQNQQIYRERHREKHRALNTVWNARGRNEIKPEPCVVCGSTEDIHGHHEDYSKPLDLMWLCRRHHHDQHNKKMALPV